VCNACGRIVVREWERSEAMRDEIVLDAFVVMPNHLHGIVCIVPPDVDDVSPRGYDLDVGPDPTCSKTTPNDDIGPHGDAALLYVSAVFLREMLQKSDFDLSALRQLTTYRSLLNSGSSHIPVDGTATSYPSVHFEYVDKDYESGMNPYSATQKSLSFGSVPSAMTSPSLRILTCRSSSPPTMLTVPFA